MYIVYEKRLLLGEAFFFFFVSAEKVQAASFLQSVFLPFWLFPSQSLTVALFLLPCPYFQSPECHKASQQKETQFPESSLQTSSLQLKTDTRLCQRMAYFMSDTSASLLLPALHPKPGIKCCISTSQTLFF